MSTTLNHAELTHMVKAVIKCSQGREPQEGEGPEMAMKPLRLPLAIHGMHGIGKTESVEQVAKELNYNFTTLHLSTQDVSDLIGIPYQDKVVKDGVETIGATRFATPDWLKDSLEDERPCIFFLDEMNRAEPYVLQTMLPFVLEGKLHTHRIRPQDIVIAAMNPDSAEYNVESIDDEALLSRFIHTYYEPKASEWRSYCNKPGVNVHPAIMALVESKEEVVNHNVSVPTDQRVQASVDRRSLTKLGQALTILGNDTVNVIGFKLAEGMIGADLAQMVIANYKTTDHLTVKNIFDGSIFKRKDVDFEQDLDKINILMDQLVSDLVAGEGKLWKFDKDNDQFTYKIPAKQLKNLDKFIQKSPQDARFSFVRSIKMEVNNSDDNTSDAMRKIMGLLQGINESLIRAAVPNEQAG